MTEVQKMRERHSRLVAKIFNTLHDSDEYWALDKEINELYNEIINRVMEKKDGK